MDIIVGPESSIATPPSGFATLFINTDKSNLLYVKLSDGTFQPYTGGSTQCGCEIASNWSEQLLCALNKGMITAAQYQSLIAQGLAVHTSSVTDPDTGDVSTTVTVGTRDIAITSIEVDDETVTVAALGTHQIVTTFTPTNASNQTLTYVTSDATKATVSATGLITGVASGTCNVSVIPNGDPSKAQVIDVTVS
jgi:uncharacterized protein YjdB